MGKDERRNAKGIDSPAPGHYDLGRSDMHKSPAWVIKPATRKMGMAQSDNNPGPGHYFTQTGEAYAEITRFGKMMLASGSKDWATRNPVGSTAPRFDEDGGMIIPGEA